MDEQPTSDSDASGVERLTNWIETKKELLKWPDQETYLREKLRELGYDYDDRQLLVSTHKDYTCMKMIFILERDHDL